MYKISIPISMSTLLDAENLPRYLDDLKRCGAARVFLGGLGNIYTSEGLNYTHPDAIKRAIDYFRAANLEVGIWVSAFGHGSALMPESTIQGEEKYTQITDISGYANEHYSNCPMDKNFIRDYSEGIRRIAQLSPDLIMLDDDFRLHARRNIKWGCFCPLHLAEFYKRIGEEIPLTKLEKLLLTGGRNKYRSTLLEVFRDSMLDFLRALRSSIDTVNPDIALGVCDGFVWDMHGIDHMEAAKIAAGKNKPFMRTSGAPYWDINIIPVVENTRQQFAWGKGSGVEMFAEGDTYPRPIYNVPSKTLELFDFLLLADGTGDGILAYLEDYHCVYDYERGYVDRFVKNQPVRDGIRRLFDNKTPVGVQVPTVPHKLEEWDFGDGYSGGTPYPFAGAMRSPSPYLLCANSIPTCYGEDSDYPLLITGENARHVDLTKLKRGAILDVTAAKILKSRGVDTGLIDATQIDAVSEYFYRYDDEINGIAYPSLYALTLKDGAEALSEFRPGGTPASYRYENAIGQRFYVLAFDLIRPVESKNFLNSYYRQADIADNVTWMAGKPLPAFSAKHPGLYILASKGGDTMSVALANVNIDDVYDPEIRLDKPYSDIRFVNCTGRLVGDTVYLSDIPPYGFAAFEVK